MKPSFKDYKSEREKAMSWWNELETVIKAALITKHNIPKTVFDITNREIQELYKHHKPI